MVGASVGESPARPREDPMTQDIDQVGGATSTRDGGRPRVVVGVDDSPGSRAALLAALAAAARRGADLDVVSAFPVVWPWASGAPVVVADLDAVLAHTGERTQAVLSEVMKEATGEGIDSVSTRVVVGAGSPAEVLVDASRDADLLVVGSRGHGAVRSALLGSVALRCITHARCPVQVVHPSMPGRPGRVVVGVDGSDVSRAAVRSAIEEASRTGAEVEAVAAYSAVDYWTDMYAIEVPTVEQIHADVLNLAEALVDEVAAAVREHGGTVPPMQVLAVEGSPSEVLVAQAADAQLLVLGSHGHGAVRDLLVGSVALHCSVHAPCPVLVVRPRPDAAPAQAGTTQPAHAPS